MSDLPRLVDLLTGGTPPRTWSVLVTVFGDLARAPGAEIPSHALTRMGDAMGFAPEAVRTAMHRLRKEDWLAARRLGRHSLYRLTESGRAQSLAVADRIYGPGPAPGAYVVLSPRPGPGVAVAQAIRVSDRPDPDADSLSFPLAAPPGWIRAALLPPETVALAEQTAARLRAASEALGAPPERPVDAAALRVLTVHAWRRLALRLPALPDAVLPGDGAVARARADAAALLARLPTPAPDAL